MCVCVCVCVCVYYQGTPPPAKQMKHENDAESANVKAKKKKKSAGPLKKSHLQLDDLPPELLPKHQERIKIKVRVGVCVMCLSSTRA